MDPPQPSTSAITNSSLPPVNPGIRRKRVDSNPFLDGNDCFTTPKKQRTSLPNDASCDSTLLTPFRSPFLGSPIPSPYTPKKQYEDRFIRRPSFCEPLGGSSSMSSQRTSISLFSASHQKLCLSRTSSVSDFSRAVSPSMADLMAMARGDTGDDDITPGAPFPEASAANWLKNTRVNFDYAPPTTSSTVTARLLTCSGDNILYFTRGDRVYSKNLSSSATDDVVQLCKLKVSAEGHVRTLAANSRIQCETMAIGTSRNQIQLWDVNTKKIKAAWKAITEITAMVWDGPILTVGGAKGTIRCYDSRLEANKIKDQCKRLIRHEVPITSLAWNMYGRHLASADASGTVLCWDNRTHVPMDVGETIQRRRKIHHAAKISAMAWCPWKSSELVTGDVDGVARLWDITQGSDSVMAPGTIETRAAITSMNFSRQAPCNELVLTHGAPATSEPIVASVSRKRVDNSISVVAYPTFKSRAIFRLEGNPEKAIGDSVFDGTGMKLIYSTPADGKLNIAEIWKKKEVKKPQIQSVLDITRNPRAMLGR